MVHQRTKTYNGQEYRKRDIGYSHKSSAKKKAEELRSTGKWKARVVGSRSQGYAVYTRPKTKMRRRKR